MASGEALAIFTGTSRARPRTADLPPLPADTRPAADIAQYDQLLTYASATEARES